jgi:hypothetical protein
VPAVLDNTVLRRQKLGRSEEEARRQLNVIAHDLCNMRRLLERRPKIN